jgi:transcriptional regulator with XRE-family HTH domain
LVLVPQVMQDLVYIRKGRMTAVEAAKRMDVTRQQIWNVENSTQGAPSIVTVERYARAVGARLKVQRLPSLPR